MSETDNGTTITRVFQNAAAGIDLISSVSNSGIYTVDVYLQVTYVTVNAAGNTTNTVTYQDNNPTAAGTAQDYQASFEVTGTRNTAEWTGRISDNWFDPANWVGNMLPSATVDAYIPYPGSGSTTQYPKIYANGFYQVSNTSTAVTYSQRYGTAVTRGLKFGGGNASAKAIAELVTGNLLIYGDYTGDYNNFIQDAGTFVTFAGSVPQSLSMVSGGDFITVNIAGVGTKTLTGNMNIANALNFGNGYQPVGSVKCG
ncbi:MAG: hypothetical protein EOO60_04510 [Hymenobacter sp.]|nr:MAG: hypothetical protein EOO60_04510 [Hymenobacter sp.]